MSKQKMRVSYELCFDLMNALAGSEPGHKRRIY